MSQQTFFLGFQIDTTPLSRAAQEASRATTEIGRLGDAERRLAAEAALAQRATDSQGQASQLSTQQQSAAAEAAIRQAEKIRDAIRSVTEARGKDADAARSSSGSMSAPTSQVGASRTSPASTGGATAPVSGSSGTTAPAGQQEGADALVRAFQAEEAAAKKFEQQQAVLTRALDAGKLTQQQYADAVNAIAQSYQKAAAEAAKLAGIAVPVAGAPGAPAAPGAPGATRPTMVSPVVVTTPGAQPGANNNQSQQPIVVSPVIVNPGGGGGGGGGAAGAKPSSGGGSGGSSRGSGGSAAPSPQDSKESADALDRLLNAIKAEELAAGRAAMATRLLSKSFQDGKIDQQKYQEGMEAINARLKEQVEAARKLADAPGPKDAGKQVTDAMQQISGRIGITLTDMAALRLALSGGAGGFAGLGNAIGTIGGKLAGFASTIGPVGVAALGATGGIVALGAAAFKASEYFGAFQDKYQQMAARFANSLGSMAAARDSMESLYKMTQQTGLGFQSAADAFGRLARNNASIGLSRAELEQLTETIQKIGAASGADPGSMSAGMLQLGQALSSGRLQGDELRSIMENFPGLGKAIASNFEKADGTIGVTIGSLRRMGSEGELTSDKIAQALLRATEEARKNFEKLPKTLAQQNQMIADSWDKLMGDMAESWNSGAFAKAIKGWQIGFINWMRDSFTNTAEGMKELEARAKALRAVYDYEHGRPNGNSLEQINKYRDTYLTSSSTGAYAAPRLEDVVDAESQVASNLLKKQKADAAQALIDAANKDNAILNSAEAATMSLRTFEAKRREAAADVKRLKDAIAKADEMYAAAPTEAQVAASKKPGNTEIKVDRTKEDLAATTAELKSRLVQAEANLNLMRNERDKARMQLNDSQTARTLGGGGGGSQIVMQAIQQQRGDEKQSVSFGLDEYISTGVRSVIEKQSEALDQLSRKAKETRATIAGIGQTRSVVREMEVEAESLAERIQLFGDPEKGGLKSDAITKWFTQYKNNLREAKKAADEAASAQQAYNAQVSAGQAVKLAEADPNQRSRNQARLDFELEQAKKTMEPKDYQRFESAKRDEAQAQEEMSQKDVLESLRRRSEMMEKQKSLLLLNTDEYEIQMKVLQKKDELEAQGYKAGEDYYETVVMTTEQVERQAQAYDKQTQRVRGVIRTWEQGADRIEGVWKDAWESIFTDGLGKGSSIFLKGFTSIIKKIGADMVYEIAIRPFQELVKQFMTKIGMMIAQTLFPGFMGSSLPSDAGTMGSPNFVGPVKALGGAYSGGKEVFAKGGTFSQALAPIAAAGVMAASPMAFANGGAFAPQESATQQVVSAYAGGGAFDKQQTATQTVVRAYADGGYFAPATAVQKVIPAYASGGAFSAPTATQQIVRAYAGGDMFGSAPSVTQRVIRAYADGDVFSGSSIAPMTQAGPAGQATASAMLPFAKGDMQMSFVTAYAGGGSFTNQIVDKPTLFAFAGGTGMMGEAGPEAIMPLKRGADGRLGVSGAGGGGDVQVIVNDMRSSAGAERAQVKTQRGSNGKRMISVLIKDEVKRQMRSGELDRDMQGNYGASRPVSRL